MAVTVFGAASAADSKTITDNIAAVLIAGYATIGTGATTETTTVAAKANAVVQQVLGDGGAIYGIGNPDLKRLLQYTFSQAQMGLRYDIMLSTAYRGAITQLSQYVLANVPKGFKYVDTVNNKFAYDLWLQRLNATSPNVQAAPAATPAVTATTGGSMAAVSSGNAPRVKLVHVSASGDWIESLPSPNSSQVALSGPNNAYSVTLSGTVPTGVAYVMAYWQLYANAGASDPYYLDPNSRTAAVPGSAYPTILRTCTDQQLRLDYQPPSWIQCLMKPEFADIFKGTYAARGSQPGTFGGLLTYNASGMLSPCVVAVNPVNSFAGVNNPPSTMLFASAAATTMTFGTLAAVNDSVNGVQGFAGAGNGLQARVDTVMDFNASLTNITYKYFDSTHPPSGAAQSATIAGPLTLVAALGSVVSLAIPAGRLVNQVTACTVTGPTGGTFVIEGLAIR